MRGVYTALGISLALTLGLELGFALAAGKRGRALLFVMLANLLTNPPVVMTAILWRQYALPAEPAAVAVLEVLAVLTEGLVYEKSRVGFSRPWLFSLAANALSFGGGALLSLIF